VRAPYRNQQSRSPPRHAGEKSNSGRYDYITKNRRSLSHDSNRSYNVNRASSSKNTGHTASTLHDDKSFVTKTEFKSVLSLLQKLNKNYNNLLQMFINEIAQRNMINKAVERDYGDTE